MTANSVSDRTRGGFPRALLASRSVTTVVGVVLSYAALWTGVPGTGANVAHEQEQAQADLCAAGDSCAPTVATEEPAAYATPVEVDCRAISDSASAIGRNDLDLFSGPCGPVISDFHYRVSRFPDSERPSGTLNAQRARRAARVAATCTGLPPDRGSLVLATAPPIAMYATTAVLRPPLGPAGAGLERDGWAPTRILAPPERPPRL